MRSMKIDLSKKTRRGGAVSRFFAFTLAFVLALVVIPSARAAAFTPVTGREMMARLGMGISPAHSLEAHVWKGDEPLENHMDYDGYWGVRLEQWHFKSIARKGFKSVRLPVTWGQHMDRSGKIYPEWMDRVQEVVDWALEEGLVVTVNTQHEAGLYDPMQKGNYNDAEKYLLNVWAQIAERFKDYPETLIFELMNEPKPGQYGWYGDYENQMDEIIELSVLVNRLNAAALSSIRKSGGNNDKRIISLTTVQASANLIHLYEHPDDPYAFLVYEHPDDPYTFLGMFCYPDEGDPARRWEKDSLAQIKTALDKGIPVVAKETGIGWEGITQREVSDWCDFMFTELRKLGVPSMWWSNSDGIFIPNIGVWRNDYVNAFFRPYGVTPGSDYPPAPPALPYELEAPYSEAWWTFWTPPLIEINAAEKMVVEYSEMFTGWYAFHRPDNDWNWKQYENGDPRITVEPVKLTFDMRGLKEEPFGYINGAPGLGFATSGEGNADKIKRIYIDTWEGTDNSDGWKQMDGAWFYYKNGAYLTGEWVSSGGKWYYLGLNGRMLAGEWLTWNGKKYYLTAPNGDMKTGWHRDTASGVWFFFGSGGAMQENVWVQSGGKWYYLKSGGYMAYGEWTEWNGNRYYLNAPDGEMLANGTYNIGGADYTFDASGALIG